MSKTKQADTKPFDFAQFPSKEAQEAGFDLEVLLPNGSTSGLVICVAGPDSPRRRSYYRTKANARIAQAKSGQRADAPTAEAIEADIIEDAVAATISWRFPAGFHGPDFTPEAVRKTYADHRDILDQVIRASDDRANFMKRSA